MGGAEIQSATRGFHLCLRPPVRADGLFSIVRLKASPGLVAARAPHEELEVATMTGGRSLGRPARAGAEAHAYRAQYLID
jgi:hypothetical protein